MMNYALHKIIDRNYENWYEPACFLNEHDL